MMSIGLQQIIKLFSNELSIIIGYKGYKELNIVNNRKMVYLSKH